LNCRRVEVLKRFVAEMTERWATGGAFVLMRTQKGKGSLASFGNKIPGLIHFIFQSRVLV
jgi:hypothetical protein